MARHPDELIVEAWGPDRVTCLEELVRGVVETFATIVGRSHVERVPIRIDPGDDHSQLVTLVEQVLRLVDALGVVPADVMLEAERDGTLSGCVDVVPLHAVEQVSVAPRKVSTRGLIFERRGPHWCCHVPLEVEATTRRSA